MPDPSRPLPDDDRDDAPESMLFFLASFLADEALPLFGLLATTAAAGWLLARFTASP